MVILLVMNTSLFPFSYGHCFFHILFKFNAQCHFKEIVSSQTGSNLREFKICHDFVQLCNVFVVTHKIKVVLNVDNLF